MKKLKENQTVWNRWTFYFFLLFFTFPCQFFYLNLLPFLFFPVIGKMVQRKMTNRNNFLCKITFGFYQVLILTIKVHFKNFGTNKFKLEYHNSVCYYNFFLLHQNIIALLYLILIHTKIMLFLQLKVFFHL